MNIAVNALLYSVGQDYRQTGISRYIDRLLANFGPLLNDDTCTAFVSAEAEPDWPGITVQQTSVPAGSPRQRIQWEHLRLPGRLRAGGFDLFHGPVNTIPLQPVRIKKVVTIHDLAFLRFPEQVTRQRWAYLKALIAHAACHADAILVPSQATARDVQELLKRPARQIHVTPLGVDTHFTRAPADQVASVRREYGLEKPYLLTVGTIEPRKNLARLIAAFAHLHADLEHDLVLVGPQGWLTDEIESAIKSSGIEDRIKRTGFVGDAGLVGLYSGADAVVVPSIYEGFGLPMLEAMACGAVVVTSNVSSLPEVAGDAAVLVDPLVEESIAGGILRALTDTGLRTRLQAAAPVRAATFTWQRTARQTVDVYRGVLT